MANKKEYIVNLAAEIMDDITSNRIALHNIILKTSRLAFELNFQDTFNQLKEWAVTAEQNQFISESYRDELQAASDPDIAVSSANPHQHVMSPLGNTQERIRLTKQARGAVSVLAGYRKECYTFAVGIYTKWKFGNIAESIFDRKRDRTEPTLNDIFPDSHQRLQSIDSNLQSENEEDWKNAVSSCRALLMDLADVLKPETEEDKQQKGDTYKKRIKEYIRENTSSKTKKQHISNFVEEIDKRINTTLGLIQGPSHKSRPAKVEAENTVLYTYLLVSDLMEIHPTQAEDAESVDVIENPNAESSA